MEQFLQKTLGFSERQICKLHKRFPPLSKTESSKTAGEPVELLSSSDGLARKQLRNFFWGNPQVLFSNRALQLLQPQLELLKSLGISKKAFAKDVSTGNRIPDAKTLARRIYTLQALPGEGLDIVSTLRKNPSILSHSVRRVKQHVRVLKQCGMRDAAISSLILSHPSLLASRPARLRSSVHYLNKLGVSATSKKFAWSLPKLLGCKGSWKDREEALAAAGFSNEQIRELLLKKPEIVAYSCEAVLQKLEFLISSGVSPRNMVTIPALLGYSLKNRLKPRYEIFKHLAADQKSIPSPSCFFHLPEQKFLKKYVTGNRDEAKLLEIIQVARKPVVNEDEP